MDLRDNLVELINQNNGFNGLTRKLTKDLKDRILEETKHLPEKSQMGERIYNIVNYDQIPVCDKGNQFKFRNYDTGYTRYCGANCECANLNRGSAISDSYKNRTEEDKALRKQRNRDSLNETKKWIPDNPNFSFEDLVDYLKERMEKYGITSPVFYKTMPFFIENEIKKHTSYLPNDAKIKERVYNILNPESNRICGCGNPVKFGTFNSGYRKFCSSNCEAFNQAQSEKVRDHCSKLSPEEIQDRVDKRKASSLENWGYENHMQSPVFMEQYQQKLMDEHGVSSVFQIPEVAEKIKQINLEKFGVEYPLQNKEFQAYTLEKSKEAQGGQFCVAARAAYKEKTGYDSCFQDPEWQQQNRINRMIDTGWGLPKSEIIFDEYNSVECPVCGEKSKVLSPDHLKSHGINSAEEFRELYPDYRRVSMETSDKISEANTGREVTVEHRMNYRNARIQYMSNYNGNGKGVFYDTKPELEFEKELKKLNVPYSKQFHTKQPHFNYDFLLWDCILVEIDGPYHRNPKMHSSQEMFEMTVMRDELKNRGAYAHGYLLGRIEVDSKLPVDWYDILVQQGINLKNNSYRKRAKNDYLCGNVTEDLKVYLELKKQLKEEGK